MHELLKKVAIPEHFSVLWYYIHKKAYFAITYNDKVEFEKFFVFIITNLPCNNCREHAMKYLANNPMRNYFNLKDEKSNAEIGLFKYTWIFHNDVNERLGKPKVDWFTALTMYSNNEGCDNCGIANKYQEKEKEDDKKKKKGKYVGKYP